MNDKTIKNITLVSQIGFLIYTILIFVVNSYTDNSWGLMDGLLTLFIPIFIPGLVLGIISMFRRPRSSIIVVLTVIQIAIIFVSAMLVIEAFQLR